MPQVTRRSHQHGGVVGLGEHAASLVSELAVGLRIDAGHLLERPSFRHADPMPDDARGVESPEPLRPVARRIRRLPLQQHLFSQRPIGLRHGDLGISETIEELLDPFSLGRAVASHGGYEYSEGMEGHGGAWDPATLSAFLTNPKEVVPGTKMSFAGLPKPEDRANVIAYLEQQGG